MDYCETSDSGFSEQVESEHAVSLQLVVGSVLVILPCPFELSGLKKDATRVDVIFVFFCPESIL